MNEVDARIIRGLLSALDSLRAEVKQQGETLESWSNDEESAWRKEAWRQNLEAEVQRLTEENERLHRIMASWDAAQPTYARVRMNVAVIERAEKAEADRNALLRVVSAARVFREAIEREDNFWPAEPEGKGFRAALDALDALPKHLREKP